MMTRMAVRRDGYLSRPVAWLYAASVALLHPLVYGNYYQNINRYKYYALMFATAVFLCAFLPLRLADAIRRRPFRPRIGAVGACLFAFVALAALSCLLSPYRALALTGSGGRMMGLYAMLVLLLLYWMAASARGAVPTVVLIFLSGGICCALLGVLNTFRIDPLGFYTGLKPRIMRVFLSTIGNRNFFSAYLCLLTPASAAFYLYGKRGYARALGGVAYFIAVAALYCARSDSGVAGLAVCLILALLTAFQDGQTLARCIALFAAIPLAGGVLQLCWIARIGALPATGSVVMGYLLSTPYLAAPGLLLAALALFIKRCAPSPARLRLYRRIAVAALLAALALILALALAANLRPDVVTLRGFLSHLRFDDNWGSQRGFVWRTLLTRFTDYSPREKLLGCGPDTLLSMLEQGGGESLTRATGRVFDAAHNEYLQILMTNGLLGLAAYLGFVACAIVRLLRRTPRVADRAFLLWPIAAYAAQAVFNIAQPITTPLFVLFIALSVAYAADSATPSV